MYYYHESPERVLQFLNTHSSGLSQSESEKRLAEVGSNQLEQKKKLPVWLQFLGQFKDFMIIILAIAAVLSGVMGDISDMVIILVILLLNAIVGFIQEFRAEKSLEALKKMSLTQTHVLRDGKVIVVNSVELVPGDVVLLEAGNVVPADLRLMEAYLLKIDEASLTGESVSVDKMTAVLDKEDISLGDQLNMAFKGTLITNGRGRGVVVATGMNTELGKIAGMLQGKEAETPLQKRMQVFSKNLSYIILVICTVLFVTGILRGEKPVEILLLAISLAVAAIPEALPALITIALSRGASVLAKKDALIRKLPAVETLGSVSFICTDKTGTLTQNKMKVVDFQDHFSRHLAWDLPLSPLLCSMSLNHDIQFSEEKIPFGESTELAMVEHALLELGFSGLKNLEVKFPRVAELPFDSDRKCMTTVHAYHDKFLVITKGASEAVESILQDTEERALLLRASERWANEGKRVLAYAVSWMDTLPVPFSYDTVEKELDLVGMVALMDPPREEVKQAIAECKTAGVKPVMITGDHPATAKAIALQIGIIENDSEVMTGVELKKLDDVAFASKVESISVYARVSPDQKLRIVMALQKKGHFVAMTGDGVNDAPSLKKANIGVAMGINGTDVSKEAAHLILLDDNFATIVKAVKEGRRIFDNIRKFVKYIMTCNGAEIWTIFMAPFLGLPMPLLPIHILWINLVTDGLPALALANEKSEADVMRRPPRATNESLFSDGVGFHIIWVGVLMAAVTLGTQAWALSQQMEHWQTMVFTVLSVSQLGHVFGIRSDRSFLFQQGMASNPSLLIAVGITFLLQMGVVYIPFMNTVFNTQPLTLQELAICIGASLVVFHAVELEKWIKKMRSK